MAYRDMLNNVEVVHLGNLTLSGTTPATSSYVDTRGYDSCTLVVVANTITDAGTASGFTVTLQDSIDTTAAAAATVATTDAVDAVVTLTETSDAADNSIIGGFGYVGGDRYVGVSATGTTGTNADISVYAVLGHAHRAATTFEGTAVART
jgi:hypothetical protein